MAKKNLYVLFDRIADEAGPIFDAVNDSVAIRSVVNMCVGRQLDENDFELWSVAEIDTQSGVVTPEKGIRHIDFVTALIIKRSERK